MKAPVTKIDGRLFCLGLALLGMLSACGPDAPVGPPREALVERWIAEDPQVMLVRDQLFTVEQVFYWTFASEADLTPWQTRGLSKTRLHVRQWLLEAAGDDPQLERQLQIDASELHDVEVTLAGLTKGAVTLFWAGPGEPFAEDRSLTVEPPAPRRRGRVSLAFDLIGHPLWRGTIDRVRLDPTDTAEDKVMLRTIRGRRRVVDSERLGEALRRSWKVDLSADARNALLAVPGIPVEREIEVGPKQRLLLSYGLEAAVQQAVEFRVEARVEGQDTAEVLFQETLDPATGVAEAWHEASLDLSAYAGRRLQLTLETQTSGILDLARGFALWANPEVVGPGGEDDPPNVIFISIDTLRSDRLSAYGHDRETSPNLDRWAAKSAVLFENAVVQAPWTLPSHASMFTGLEALRHDVNHYQEAPTTLEMLAETLRRAGYSTAAITGGGYLRPKFGFAQGFDIFRYWPQILAESELADGMERTLSWLDSNGSRPFFLFFHTYEVHFPHRRRQPYFDQFDDSDPARSSGPSAVDSSENSESAGLVRGEFVMRARPQEPGNPLWQHDYFVVKLASGEEVEHLNEAEKVLLHTMYDSSIAYVDAQLGRLFQHLEELGLDRRTLIVLTSDHGEALGEEDRAGHNYLEDYNVMVPLVIELPGGRGAGKRIDQQVRSIDIVPTILDALGIAPENSMDGVSLLPLISGNTATVPAEAWTYASSANYGLGLRYRNQLKYVFNNTAWSRFLGGEELYDLRRDPGEQDNQAELHPSTAELRAKAFDWIDAKHEGLRMRISNRGEGRLSGQLTHGWASHNRVKAADPSCRCLTWAVGKNARFSLGPNQEVTLYFESIPGNRVGLRGRLDVPGEPATTFNEIFDPREIREPVGLEHSLAGWQRVTPADEPKVNFTIWRQNPSEARQVMLPVDEKLQRQLEALGYVDG